MKYELYEGDTKRDAVVADLEDNFAAETRAKRWVRENAKGDRYTLRRADGALTLSIFRTQAGQWYLTPARALETQAS
jgi:hypothetical protein